MSKEIFGEEVWAKVEATVKEKGLNLILDNKEKPEYIPKNRFDEIIGSKNELKTQVSELSTQLETLKKAAKGNDELTKTIEELQKKNGDWEGKYKSTLLESAIKINAMKEKAKDPSDLIKFLDASKLEIDDQGNVKGLEDQLKVLKESKPYLFGETIPGNPPPNPPNGGNGTKTEEQQLEEQRIEAVKNGNNALAVACKNKLFILQHKK
jgi:hypothetical protein